MEQPSQNASPRPPAEGSPQRASRSGLDHSSAAPGATPVLGPDGSPLPHAAEFTSGFGRLVNRNPVLASAASLAVGLIVGMLVGASVARD